MKNRFGLLMAILLVSFVLTACQEPNGIPTERWGGTSFANEAESPIELVISRQDDSLEGTYTVGLASGTFTGTLDGETVEAVLMPAESCTYALTGVMTDTTLEAEFVPLDCPDGQSGSWLLEKE